MLDYNRQRKLVVLCVVAIILVVVFTVMYLIDVWTPEPEKQKVYEVGVVESNNIDNSDVLMQYYGEVSEMLMNSKLDDICSKVGEDYLKYYGYTLDDVKKYIADKNIMGKRLELVNSAIYSVVGYNNIFYLDIKAEGEVYSLGVIIRETSPEQYTIALDKFIDYKENVVDEFVNSVGFRVQKQARFINNVVYRVKITNNYDKPITINADREVAPLMLVSSSNGTIKKPLMSSLTAQEVIIESGHSREYDVSYNIENHMDFIEYNVFVLRGVKYEGVDGVSNLEFYMQ